MSSNLSTLDYLVLLLYLAGTLALGLYLGRRIKTGEDYFLAGRRLPWWAIGMSLVATDIGGPDIIGVGGAAYTHGLAVANFEWIGCVPAMIVAAFVFIPLFWRSGIYTIPEFMERRFNAVVRSTLALCWLVFMACNLGVMLLAAAQMLTTLFGWSAEVCILVMAAMVGVYTVAGGLAAVVYTDAIQCVVMIGGCLLVLVLGLAEVGGWSGLMDKLHEREQVAATDDTAQAGGEQATSPRERVPQRARLVLPVDTPTPFPWTGILFGLALVLSPAYWIGNQAIVQRSLGAKSEFEAKAAYVWGAVLKNVIPIVIAVPGLIAVAKFPDLDTGDKAVPSLVAELLPAGLRGVFLAAFIAALMSSVDSYLNSASTLVTNDLYKRFIDPHADARRIMIMGRGVTVGLVVWAVFFAMLLMQTETGIYAIFQTMMSFFQGPALAVLLTGLLWRRATGIAASIGLISGILFAITLYALSREDVYTALGWQPLFQIADPFLYFSVWAFLLTLTLVVVISFMTTPEPEEKLQYVVNLGRKGRNA